MNPLFETMGAANSYFAFKNNISNIASFLKLDTVINFTALSKFYNNILNNPKSSFGKNFWKEFAIQNQNIKKFKGANINYFFKIILKKVKELKRATNLNYYNFFPFCDKCDKECCPDDYSIWHGNDAGYRYCNCKIVKCKTKRDFLKAKYQKTIENHTKRNDHLMSLIEENRAKLKDAIKQKEKLDNMPNFKSIIPVLENLKENARYKNTRSQSQRLYLEVKNLSEKEKNERPNMNYTAPP